MTDVALPLWRRLEQALRHNLASDPDEFPRNVQELADYFSDSPRQAVRAVPGTGLKVPLWILGSSLCGAQVAAAFGLPYIFESHFAPAQMMAAIAVYRSVFRPSRERAKTLRDARPLRVRRRFSDGSKIPGNLDAAGVRESAQRAPFAAASAGGGLHRARRAAGAAILDQVLSCASIGTLEMVRADLHAACMRSFEIVAEALADVPLDRIA